jgi:hypothetical protein
MYNLENVYPIVEERKFRSRGVMSIPATSFYFFQLQNHLKNSAMSNSLSAICELSVSPDAYGVCFAQHM